MTSKVAQSQAVWFAKMSGHLTPKDAGRIIGVDGRNAQQVRRVRAHWQDPGSGQPTQGAKGGTTLNGLQGAMGIRTYMADGTAIEEILVISEPLHNTAYVFLLTYGVVDMAYKRAKRVLWVRHKWTHFTPLCHMDWLLFFDSGCLTACEDNASCFVMGCEIFDCVMTVNAVRVLWQEISEYSKLALVMAYYDARSCATEAKPRFRGATEFEWFLVANEIRRVLSCVGHLQTTGKLGRLFGEGGARLDTFANVDEVAVWRNTAKLNWSLNFKADETPCEAFESMIPPEDAGVVVSGITDEAYRVYREPPGPEGF